MNAKKIIWEEIGEELQKNSFEYAGWKNNAWTYEISKEPKHTLAIVKYRFGENCISYELIGRAGLVVQASAIDSLSKYNIGMNYYRYDNEEEFRLIVREFWNEVKKRGWKNLDKNFNESKDNNLSKWNLKLYDEHEALCKNFIESNSITITELNEESMNRYFDTIEKMIDCHSEVNMELVVRTAAFLGQLLIDNMGAKWVLRKKDTGEYSTLLDNINAVHNVSINLLVTIYQEAIGNFDRGNLRRRMITIINDAK